MPTYEYACAGCGHAWEQVQRITEPPIELCPNCKKSSAHRLISGGTNFILKGGGWYSDLYASPKPAANKPAESAAQAPTDGAAKSPQQKAQETSPSKSQETSSAKPAPGGLSNPAPGTAA